MPHPGISTARRSTGTYQALREANKRLVIASLQAQGLAERAEAVAEFGHRALAGTGLPLLMEEAVALVARTLGVEFAGVLEFLPDDRALRLQAGVGRRGGTVGHATVDLGMDSLASYTVLAFAPVVVEDVRADPRFKGSTLLGEHGVVSGLSVPIASREQPFGVLGAGSATRRAFTQEDVHFLEAVANVLAAAIERQRAEDARTRLIYEQVARAEAEAEQARLLAILESAPYAIIYLEAESGRVIANHAASQVLGRPLEPGAGRAQYLAQVCRPDGRPLVLKELPSSRALQGQAIRDEELLTVQPDGRLVPVLMSAAPVRDRGGKVIGAVVVLQDISALKELERLREEWTSVIAHDLRQPVTIIAAYASLLARRAGRQEVSLPEHQKGMEHILASARQLDRMIADLLDVSRLEAGRLKLERRTVDLVALVHAVVERMAEVTQGHPVRVEVTGDLPPLEADAQRIEQVLGNLLSNAAKYGYPETDIRVEVERVGGEVQVAVTNGGEGIPPEEVADLFTRFHRTRQASAGPVQGLGLGLYLSHVLVQAHGGRMWVESIPSQSTTFRFTLPTVGDPSTSSG